VKENRPVAASSEQYVVIGALEPDGSSVVVKAVRKKRPVLDKLLSAIGMINPYYRRITVFEGTPEEIKLKGYEVGVRIKLDID